MSDQENRALPPRFALGPLRRRLVALGPLRRRLVALGRPLPLFALLCFWLHDYDTAPEAARREPDPARSLAVALRSLGLGADPSQVLFLPDQTPRGAVTRHD